MDADLSTNFNLFFRMLKVLGLWQDGNQSWKYFIYGYLLHFVLVELNICGQILYVINVEITKKEDWIDLLRMFFTWQSLRSVSISLSRLTKSKRVSRILSAFLNTLKFRSSAQENTSERGLCWLALH